MKMIDKITLILLLSCIVSCKRDGGASKSQNRPKGEMKPHSGELLVYEDEAVSPLAESQAQYEARLRKELGIVVDYHADKIIDDVKSDRIILLGNAWYSGGGRFINATLDPESKIILERSTLTVIKVEGKLQSGGVIMPLAK